MSVAAPPPAPGLVPAGHRFRAYTALRPFSVVEYERMIDSGILTDEDKVELLDGHVVLKMPSNAPHASAIQSLTELLPPLLPVGWSLRGQQAILLPTSAPEPDIALVRGSSRDYRARHPNAAEAATLLRSSIKSIESRVYRAKRQLAARLRDEGVSSSSEAD